MFTRRGGPLQGAERFLVVTFLERRPTWLLHEYCKRALHRRSHTYLVRFVSLLRI